MATKNTQIIIPNAQEPTKPLTMITIHNSIKLTPTNYLSWKTQMEAILIGYDLQKFIDGSHPAPPTTITTNNVVSTNPAYQTWLRQDKLLFGALVGTLSPTLVPLITQSKTSYEAWQILANTYARPSRGHIKQLKDHLKNITKGSQSITDYMQSIKTQADELAALGKPLDQEDLIKKVLEGLDENYQSIIDVVNGRDSTISFDELHEKLINKELSLRNKISPSPLPASAHATNVRSTPWSVTNRTPRLPGKLKQMLQPPFPPTPHGYLIVEPHIMSPMTYTILLSTDLHTGAILLQGRTKDGVYEWPLSTSKSHPLIAFSSVKTTLSECFGCLCYPWLRPYTSHKLESRSSPCVFVEYSPTQSAYLCLDTSIARLYTFRHVRFVESIFPFVTSHTSLPRATSSTISEWCSMTLPVVATPSVNVGSAPPSSMLTPTTPSQSQDPSQHNTTCATPTPEPNSHSSAPVPKTKCDCANNPPLPPTQNDPNQSPVLSPSPHVIVTRSKRNIHKPIQKLNLTAQLQQPTLEPTTVTQALKDPKWRQAMSAEFDALLYRYKARLVAKGFHQRPGVDYSETFSLVIKPTIVRLVLSLAVSQGWSLRQLDVNNAFLQGTLTEDVFMSQPPGFIDRDHPHHVCKLRKAIYGLKQAPRAWYHELRQFLLQFGFINSIVDTSLFIFNNRGTILYLLVYVDDIIITGNNVEAAQTFIQQLSQRFSLKNLGPLTYFLGVEVTSHTNGLFLSQCKYIADLLNITHMTEAKPAPTPLATSPILTLQSGTPLSDPTEYRTVVVKRLLRYLCGTLDHDITLRRTSPLALHAFSDSDWAGNKDDFTSTSAYIIYLGHNPISWSSKKQRNVARSSTEAEYRSVASTAAEIRWIYSLLTELGVTLPQQPVIYCDNVGATHLCSNPVFHSRMKHVALDYHFIREQVQNGLLRVSHISASDQLANALTKPLARPQFGSLKAKIGLAPRPSILRGHDKDIQSS
ncbi:Retrovirus-related Pol polyprotein from transposon RE1 [Vitis vinifera]|uniref:Retrovirus-related Pol polyprotein from transposon RE1 n=1 Tax=Vitis vinifera TaxID=29760 RepID=A0A438JXJ9_VITVI|nr:Retrovirus-related Pol polyprotein from transposon RE1 [Vitis vinifera]